MAIVRTGRSMVLDRKLTRRQASLAGGLLVAAGLGACSAESVESQPTRSKQTSAGPTETSPAPTPTTPTTPPGPQIKVAPQSGAKGTSPIDPVLVSVDDGTLTDVRLTNPEGRRVRGTMHADRTQWRSTEPLGYDRTYQLTASATGAEEQPAQATASFTTLKPARVVFPSFYPAPGTVKTMGVGQPLTVIFDKAPSDRSAAERALQVTTTPKVAGSWYWWDERTVHYRPQKYWKPGTKITLQAKVYGVDLGAGSYGETDRTIQYAIGPSRIAIIDDKTKMMTVYISGKQVKQIPVSMGQNAQIPGADDDLIDLRTQSGIHVVAEKYPLKRMTSASYGLPGDYSLGYDREIPLAVRISNSGEFVHSAPWSVADQGVRNVSHGCININPEAAQWFYDTFSYGDIVSIRNTGRTMPAWDGYGDWNIPWNEWQAGSALR